ncbi:MAG: TolC family protein [Bacteroidota bacterium]|nr:TolC family protein [Bacteroidota bacterium]
MRNRHDVFITINIQVFFLIIFQFASMVAQAQSSIDSVMASVLMNNKAIQATAQYEEFRKLQYKTSLFPQNPQLEYDYLKGSPSNVGNQTEIVAFQTFDFPSAYAKRKQLAKEQIAQSEQHLIIKRREILLETKLVCIELVYRNKLNKELIQRKSNSDSLLKFFEKKLNLGDGNILDVNKVRLQLLAVNSEYQENIMMINQLNSRLTALNGGKSIAFSDTSYFSETDIPTFEKLQVQFEAADPLLLILEQEKLIVQKEMELTRALSYPRFEAGYHYQGILGQNYNGFHTGITIPLWENKNKVKSLKSKVLFTDLELWDHKNEHYHEMSQLYEKYKNLEIIMVEYQNMFLNLNSDYLLNKSLTSGHLSAIEYFMEINYYATAMNNYLRIEKEYYQTIAELYKFEL